MSANLNVLSSIRLPPVSGNEARLLHTVVQDGEGNIYYSDEFNHSVVSLDADGKVRWAKSGKGQAAGQFFYPRGIALGWITEERVLVECLAVCDSWNGRIQFFQLDGKSIGSWKSAGDLEFREVADIRFLTSGQDSDPKAGRWLVLDRSNHRLCSMDLDGQPQSQFGRYFDPLREGNWAADIMKAHSGSRVFDPLSHADRILGRSEEALFVWEPLPRHLKQIVRGNLYTVPVSAPQMGEWIVADARGLVSWSRSSGMLSFYDCLGSQLGEVQAQGRPVFSDSSWGTLWIQQETELRRLVCDIAFKDGPATEKNGRYVLLESTTMKKIACVLGSGGPWTSALAGLQSIADMLLADARRSIELLSGNADEAAETQPARIEIGEIQAGLSKAAADMTHAVRDLPALLLPNFLSDLPAKEQLVRYPAVLQDYSAQAQECLDDIWLLRGRVQVETLRQPERSEHARLLQIEDNLQMLMGGLDRTNELFLSLSEIAPVAAHGAVRYGRGFMREVDRIFVSDPATNRPGHPNHLTRTSDGHIFVTGWNQVLHLDPKGKIIERLERLDGEAGMLQSPVGIAADSSDRVWVAEFEAARLSVYDTRTHSFAPIAFANKEIGPLNYPHGLCYRPDGWMLVADTANSRILAVSETGHARVLASQSPGKSGKLWLPIGISNDPTDSTGNGWAVDHRNHRLQEFDREGNFIREIGGCGIGKGRFILPECASFLAGGFLLVSQRRFNRVIKLLTREGTELEQWRVDYSPAGILEHDGFILIANVEGSDIRVYEHR
jgi:hypothetical protein